IQYFSEKSQAKAYIKLPNLIDEQVFRDDVANLKRNKNELRSHFGVEENTQMWVLPARLIEIKGIIPFLKLMKDIKNVHLFILGEGELMGDARPYVEKEKLPVTLVGFVQQKQVREYYASADVFILLSLKVPSPLSPIEACASGLPLLGSSRIGNLEDVLVTEKNGWHYDPISETEKGKQILQKVSKMSRNQLAEYGNASLNRYNEVFDSRKCIEIYAKEVSDFVS